MTTKTLPRITARVDLDTQELLTKAAALSGITSINAFVLNSAVEKAKQIIESEQSIKLSQKDAMLFIEALDRPEQVNNNLKSAFNRYENSQA